MSGNKENVPKVRFPGFSGTWEEREYGEVIDLLSGQDFSPSEYNDTCNGIPYMTGASCIVGNETIVNRWTTVPRCLAEKGDVLLVCKGSGYGAIAVLTQDKAHIARQFMALKNSPNLDKVFNFYILNSVIESIKKDARGLIAGIARDAVIKQEISIPSLDEQSRIGIFFQHIDNLITLHQRKLNNIKNLKTGLLQKMFPKNGEDFPEVRFPGFTDAWEQRKLGELCNEFRSGEFIKAVDISPLGEYPVYGGNGIRGYAKAYNHDGEFALIGRQGALCGNMQYSCGKAYFTEHAVAVSANNENNTRFLYYLFGIMNLGQYSGQSAQPGLAVGNLVELKTLVAIKAEQSRISVLFTEIDNLITLHQRKLERVQELKKALLQQMFV